MEKHSSMPNYSLGAVITCACSSMVFAAIAIFGYGRAFPTNPSNGVNVIGGIVNAAAYQYVIYAAAFATIACLLGAVLLYFQPKSTGASLDDVFKERQRELL
jgi:membrane protein DedA with SNARE-associated domain